MTVTDKLLRVYRVDKRINGLQSRLKAAEQFLGQQNLQIETIGRRSTAIDSQVRQLKASQAEAEGEAAQHEAHIQQLRDRMNSAKTNKEYKALLVEVNTFKDKKGAAEAKALELMEKIETFQAERGKLSEEAGERTRVKELAESERAQRAEEIREQLSALTAERAALAAEVPASAMSAYVQLVERLDEEAMAPIEIADRKRHEFHCGGCMMLLPVEAMSALLSHGSLTQCPSCGCILYVEEKDREAMSSGKR
jgi:predicted  nucleic acid-binding Zn-ribbon protein